MKLHKFKFLLILATVFLLLPACDPTLDDKTDIGATPTAEDVSFTFEYDADNPNIVHFTNTSPGFIAKWNLGNGTNAEGDEVTGAYPLKGEYTVTLTIFTAAGRAANSQVVSIAETNPAMLNTPEFILLTGGPDQLEGKTWVIDSTRAGHMGVGPIASFTPEFWQAPPLDKVGLGLYDDEMTFKLLDFVYELKNNGNMFVNGLHAGDFGGDPANGDQLVPFTPPDDLNWSLVQQEGRWFLSITNGGTIGFYTGVSTYEVLTLEENELFIRFLDSKNPDLAWYHRLIPKGYMPPPPPDEGTELPVDFEDEVDFEVFGGSSFAIVDNPNPSGINTSARVAETVHGNEPWAGIFTDLDGTIDFSTDNLFKMKVWSPIATTVTMKLENSNDDQQFVEVIANVANTSQWEELTFDFTDQASGIYDRLVLFFDFGGPEGTTFYFDDIRQDSGAPPFTVDRITGGTSKAWRLKPIAGALAVGPTRGSSEWWGNAADEVDGGRACWFNDEYIFYVDGTYEYDTKGDVYAEGYMGVDSDGCIDEGEVPADAQAWTSGTHSFTFTPEAGVDPPYITVTGTGAFIALPKAFNGGEYGAAPPEPDASVTYEVLSYENDGNSETLVLTIDISAGQAGESFWTFTLEAVQ